MRNARRFWLGVILGVSLLFSSHRAEAQAFTGPLPSWAYIQFGGLDWAWASPCNFLAPDSCGEGFVLVDGFRFATPEEWANRPDASAFLDPDGNYLGSGGPMRCASGWFDLIYTHCDYLNYDQNDDPTTDLVASGPGVGAPEGWAETWLVRGSAVPEPGTIGLVGFGLVAVGLARRRRRA